MKESELIKTRNKVESMRNIMQTIINKITMLESLFYSMAEIIKRLDPNKYESIIKQIEREKREPNNQKIKER
jgi:hypothetical protein|tara:strand:- start:335 stop:550 length:216 start_codon:yes stop_codon:yes gene_type:complete